MRPVLLLLTLLPLSAFAETAAAAPPPPFPAELQGVWHPAPYDCESSTDAENDMRFEVSGHRRLNYEDIETSIQVVALRGSPLTWRLTTASNVVGDDAGQARVYVLGQKYLFVTDGDRMDQYLQCR